MKRLFSNGGIALQAVMGNKLRSGLTALGIIFGVASVIAMLAVGRGTQVEVLRQFELIGANNIVVTPVVKSSDRDGEGDEPSYSEGLDLRDLEGIAGVVPSVRRVSPEIVKEVRIIRQGRTGTGRVVGTTNDYFEMNGFRLAEGSLFSSHHMKRGERVCVLGASVVRKYFREEDVIGREIKCGLVWLEVIGILEPRNISASARSDLGIRDYDADIYIPVQTHLLRFENRALITNAIIQRERRNDDEEEENVPPVNYHQVDRITVQVDDAEYMESTAEVLGRFLQRRHHGTIDFEVDIPILALEQKRQSQEMFKWVLVVIAGISLVVGGIGIMNIMLASVLERIKEIGLRKSIGATRRDIIAQFLLESVAICLFGGIIGVLLGLLTSAAIQQLMGVTTMVTGGSILLAFAVAVAIGVLFGWLPARRAASQDPITSLRYE